MPCGEIITVFPENHARHTYKYQELRGIYNSAVKCKYLKLSVSQSNHPWNLPLLHTCARGLPPPPPPPINARACTAYYNGFALLGSTHGKTPIVWHAGICNAFDVFVTKYWPCSTILGAFAKLRKATISCVTSVRPSVHMEQLYSHWTDFYDIIYLSFFPPKICRENSSFVKMWQQ